MPDDLLEGAGDLTVLDRHNNPLGPDGTTAFELIQPESPDGWYPYLGTAAQGTSGPTKQAAAPLPISRPSFLGNQPLIQGDLPPSLLVAAKIPRPEKPILVAETVGIEGFPAGPATSPYFVAHTFVKGGRHSLLSPFRLVPPVSNGQSIRDYLPEQIPEGVTHIGVWVTEPGKSMPDTPGPAYLQREVDVSRYNPGFYDLTGPFRYDKPATTLNETVLSRPSPIDLMFVQAAKACKAGTYYARATWSDANGETLASDSTGSVFVPLSSSYTDDEGNPLAGSGYLRIFRPQIPPPGATGWRPYLFVEGQYHAVYDSFTGRGNETPYPLDQRIVQTTGWSSATDNKWSTNEVVFITQRSLPAENTTGIENPTEAAEEPVALGIVRPPAGTYYAGVTETLRGAESVMSEVSSITISANQIPRIIRRDHVNLLPNGDNTEVGSDGLPLDQTAVITNGTVTVDGADLVLTAQDATGVATTPSSTTRAADVSVTRTYHGEVHLVFENPPSGSLSGSVEVVLEEITTGGAVTQTVLGTTSSVGEVIISKVVYPTGTTGLPGGSVTWQATTFQARILVRFVGTSPKNARVRIRNRQLYPHRHVPRRNTREARRRKQEQSLPGFVPKVGQISVPKAPGSVPPDIPHPGPSELPPGSETDAIPPPVSPPVSEPLPGASPALVVWPAPDRPSGTGTTLETKHTFESAMPTGWAQVTVGQGGISRQTTSSLTGSGFLRSLKSVAGP